MKKGIIIISILAVFTFVLILVKGITLNHFSSSGPSLTAINQDIIELKRQNAVMKKDLLDKSSLTFIYEDAEETGYEKINKNTIVNMTSSLPVAYSR